MKSITEHITDKHLANVNESKDNGDFKVGDEVLINKDAGGNYAGKVVTIKVIDYPYALVRAFNGSSAKYLLSDMELSTI